MRWRSSSPRVQKVRRTVRHLLLFAVILAVVILPALAERRWSWRGWRPRTWDALAIAALFAAGYAVYGRLLHGEFPWFRDHNVHLLKILELEHLLGSGRLIGWVDHELAGYPHDLQYPFPAYLLVAIVDAMPGLSLTYAYCVVLFFTMLAPALAVFAAARLHLSTGVAWVAASLALFDPGGWLVGGYFFAMGYGVWPCSLGASLFLIGLSLAIKSLDERSPAQWAASGALIGLSILVHPISVLLALASIPALGLALFHSQPRVPALRAASAVAFIAVAAAAVCSFWLLPMTQALEWSLQESLWSDLPAAAMWQQVAHARLMHHPALWFGVGVCGLLMLARRADLFSRTIAIGVPLLVLLSTNEVRELFGMRTALDTLQLTRVFYLVRPLFFIAVGFALVQLFREARSGWRDPRGRLVAGLLLGLAVVAPGKFVPGSPRVAIPQGMSSEARRDYEAALDAVDPAARVALYTSDPDDHSLVGPAAVRGLKVVKIGYTPATQFEHQVPRPSPQAVARLGTTFAISKGPAPPAWQAWSMLARHGEFEVRRVVPLPRAWIEGPGEARVESWEDERIRIQVSGVTPRSRLCLMLGFFDGWTEASGLETAPFVLQGVVGTSLVPRNGSIELRYHTPGVWAGAAVSVGCVAGLLLMLRAARDGRWRIP